MAGKALTAQDVWAMFAETDRKMQETDRRMQETDRKIKELGKQIGGLGDKFGYFTEGMALPSMEKILYSKYKMEVVYPRSRVRKKGRGMEIDVLAWANSGINLVIINEIKSRVKEDSIHQLHKMLDEFLFFYPEHAGKKRMGILTGMDWDFGIPEKAMDAGFLTASIHDNIFAINSPKGFQPKYWS